MCGRDPPPAWPGRGDQNRGPLRLRRCPARGPAALGSPGTVSRVDASGSESSFRQEVTPGTARRRSRPLRAAAGRLTGGPPPFSLSEEMAPGPSLRATPLAGPRTQSCLPGSENRPPGRAGVSESRVEDWTTGRLTPSLSHESLPPAARHWHCGLPLLRVCRGGPRPGICCLRPAARAAAAPGSPGRWRDRRVGPGRPRRRGPTPARRPGPAS